jgi:hypothetical protein
MDFCLNKIILSFLGDIEQSEAGMQATITQLESQLWKLFAELMDSDCLNAAKPDMFLAMKNQLQILIRDAPSTELDLHEKLREAFADLQQPQKQKTLAIAKKQAKPAPVLGKRPVQTISEQLQGMRDVQLRTQILDKIARDALPSNRMQHEFTDTEVSQLMVSLPAMQHLDSKAGRSLRAG